MKTFLTIWVGQLISTLGSFMTVFALTLWVWDRTESATALTLVLFFAQLPRIVVTLFAGILTDRFNRQRLMLLGDTSAAISTAVVGMLWLTGSLQVWHLCLVMAVHGCFSQLQQLAYSASIALMVSKEQYTRVGSLNAAVGFAAAVLSPAFAGGLYPQIGLGGIMVIDLLTFTVAFGTLLSVTLPQPTATKKDSIEQNNPALKFNLKDLTFGFRYIKASPGLSAMVVAFTLFAIPNDIGRALYNPMILARTGGDAQILGAVTTMAGIGGVVGALGVSIWGGFKRRIDGMLLGFTGTGLSKLALAIGQSIWVWFPAQFFAHLHTPLVFSSSNAIWYAKVPPAIQGKVLAADTLVGLIVGAIAPLMAGPLADYIFEPAMAPGGWLTPIFGPWLGTGSGSGIALMYGISAIAMIAVGIAGYGFTSLREVERIIPDAQVVQPSSAEKN
ncbi:MAG: MFS transporter [Symploca sp. SIO2G7]|nr:MFS transporter [Symploca sp. SIO2G7]